jgi:DNA polymerase-3 subunit epsilon
MTKPFAHLRLTRPLVSLDVETTGLSPRHDRIIEIAMVKFHPEGRRDRFHRRVDPEVPIPAAATAIHGLTDQDVAGSPKFKAIAGSVARFLRTADLCGFNIKNFDLPFLFNELSRAGIRVPLGRRAVIDALQIYRHQEPRDLIAAVRRYLGRDHALAHSALGDAYAAAAVLDGQVASHTDLPGTVAELHARFTDVDLMGRLKRQNGEVVLAFGKYTGRPLAEVASDDPGYLRWLLDQDFLPDFQAIVRQALGHRCEP